MSETLTISELQAIRTQLLDSLQLIDAPDGSEQFPALASADETFVTELMREPEFSLTGGFCGESVVAVAALRDGSDKALRQALLEDVDLLRRVKEAGTAQVHRSETGIIEAAFPVRISGRIVYCLLTGPLKEGPFNGDQREVLEDLGAADEGAMAAVPVFSPDQVDRIIGMYRTLARSLGHALGHHMRTQDLTNQVVQSERTRSLGTLSSGISHHFNGLLSIILGYSSFILNREESLSPETEESLRQISEAAQRGRRMTEELLSFAGSEAEEESISHVHDTLSNVISLLETQNTSRITVKRNFAAGRDTVQSLPSDIHQIVFNLLNICLESPVDGEPARVNTSNVSLSTESGEQEYLRIEVINGPDQEEKSDDSEALTDSMSGLDQVESEQQELQLSSLYGMVRRIDGTLMVAPDVEVTNRIEVLLPVCETMPESGTQNEVPVRKTPKVSSRIWVVDDDPLFRTMVSQVLGDEGHQMEECEGGSEMIELWDEGDKQPDLVVLDFSMPEYNGLELRQWLKDHNPKIPVVLVSGLAPNQPDIKKALQMKKTYFLQKPFSDRELSDVASIAMGETLLGE